MNDLLLAALGGFAASMVDGALGMGFGPTSSTVLLSAGVSPVATATTVNLTKIATGLAGGGAHWRLGNLHRPTVARLAAFGSIGAVIGAAMVVTIDESVVRPLLAGVLLVMGLRVLIRFLRPPVDQASASGPDAGSAAPAATETDAGHRGVLGAVATAGGLATGMAGSWGPVVTPYLLARRVAPRVVVGSVNTAEVAVATVAAVSLMSGSAGRGVDPAMVLAMMSGGVAAAPVAARLVHRFPPRLLGLIMGFGLVGSQGTTLADALGVPVPWWVLVAAVSLATAWVVRTAVTDARRPEPAGHRELAPSA